MYNWNNQNHIITFIQKKKKKKKKKKFTEAQKKGIYKDEK